MALLPCTTAEDRTTIHLTWTCDDVVSGRVIELTGQEFHAVDNGAGNGTRVKTQGCAVSHIFS